MAIALIIVAAVIVVVIALVAVGRTVFQLEAEDAPSVLRVEDAVEWIAERLPDETSARLSYEDVTQILEWHVDFFATVGMRSEYGEELATGDVVGTEGEDLIADGEAAIDFVVQQAIEAEVDLEPVDAVVVIDLQMQYLELIGAIG